MAFCTLVSFNRNKTEIPSSIKSQNSSSIMNIFFWKALHPFCLKSRQETVFTTVCLSADMMEMLIGYATLATKSILVAYLFSPPPFAHSSLAHNLYLSHTNTYKHTRTLTNTRSLTHYISCILSHKLSLAHTHMQTHALTFLNQSFQCFTPHALADITHSLFCSISLPLPLLISLSFILYLYFPFPFSLSLAFISVVFMRFDLRANILLYVFILVPLSCGSL